MKFKRKKDEKIKFRIILFFADLILILNVFLISFASLWSHEGSILVWSNFIFFSGIFTAVGVISAALQAEVKKSLIQATLISYTFFNIAIFTLPGGLGFFAGLNILLTPLIVVSLIKLKGS
ncbi:MAG: hypothetical protein WDZ40_03195 [Candidatus Spechtbacterales bacterium]